jgi:ribonuclease HI
VKKVNIYTDGACSGNPGPGGYGVILEYNGKTKEISGGAESTTNNRMELTAVIAGLSLLKESCEVTLYTDSKYVSDAVEKKWVYSWREKGWKKADKTPALNVDLWEVLLPLLEKHRVRFVWIKGHDGHVQNEKCDKMAVAEAKKFSKG